MPPLAVRISRHVEELQAGCLMALNGSEAVRAVRVSGRRWRAQRRHRSPDRRRCADVHVPPAATRPTEAGCHTPSYARSSRWTGVAWIFGVSFRGGVNSPKYTRSPIEPGARGGTG